MESIMMHEELLKEADKKADEFCDKLSFEFYWDFIDIDKEFLQETVSLIFIEGYMTAKTKEENKVL